MLSSDEMEWERQETADELAELLRIAQAMTQRLARETHGETYDEIMVLAETLHQARAISDSVRAKLPLNRSLARHPTPGGFAH